MATPNDDADEERTDPESPTGLRRSLAAQSNEVHSLRAELAQAIAVATDANRRADALQHALEHERRRFRYERAANIVVCLILLASLAFDACEWFTRRGWHGWHI